MATAYPKLTPRQLAYAQARLEGLNQKDSYQQAAPNNHLADKSLRVEASKMERHPKVRAYIDTALAEKRNEVLLTRDKKRQILGSIALDVRAPKPARIQAIHQDNLMTGDHKPVRIEGEITLYSIFTALQVSTGLPDAHEVGAIKNVTPTKELPAPADPIPEKTAMERTA